MPGLVAVTIGVGLVLLGALALLAGLLLLALSALRPRLRPGGGAASAAGLWLGLCGAALTAAGERTSSDAVDAAAFAAGPVALACALVVALLVRRALRRRAAEAAPPPSR